MSLKAVRGMTSCSPVQPYTSLCKAESCRESWAMCSHLCGCMLGHLHGPLSCSARRHEVKPAAERAP